MLKAEVFTKITNMDIRNICLGWGLPPGGENRYSIVKPVCLHYFDELL